MPIKLKKIIWVMVPIIAILSIFRFATLIQQRNVPKNTPGATPISSSSLFVGDLPREITAEPKRIYREIDYVWDQIHMGSSAIQAGKLTTAAEYYKKAFDGLPGNASIVTPERGLGAKYLIETYEKLGRYDDALETLDTLDRKFYKGEFGIKESAEIRTRILAAKQAAIEAQYTEKHTGQRPTGKH